MARKQITQLIDDLDGEVLEDGGVTIAFALEGRAYEVDLSPQNAEKLREALTPFVIVARPISSSESNSKGRTRPRSERVDVRAVREWARANSYPINERGRIPATIQQAYEEATGTSL